MIYFQTPSARGWFLHVILKEGILIAQDSNLNGDIKSHLHSNQQLKIIYIFNRGWICSKFKMYYYINYKWKWIPPISRPICNCVCEILLNSNLYLSFRIECLWRSMDKQVSVLVYELIYVFGRITFSLYFVNTTSI